jgi:hypothetical protein
MLAAAAFLTTLLLADPVPVADGAAVPPPRLRAGDQLEYSGEVQEASERFGNRFRKRSDLDVRLLVLESGPAHADGILLTRLRPRLDPAVAVPGRLVLAGDATRPPATTRVDLVRIDGRGRVALLTPKGAVGVGSRLDMTRDVEAGPPLSLPLDGPPATEGGFVVPLPLKPAAVGTAWDAPDGDRPPVRWTAAADDLWRGGRCVDVRALQQSEGYDAPLEVRHGWRLAGRVLVSPADGTACRVERRVERRVGSAVVGWVEVTYELRPGTRLTGDRFEAQAREAVAAYLAGVERDRLLADRAAPEAFKSLHLRVERFLADQPAGDFREALEASRRSAEAAASGRPLAVAAALPPVHRVAAPKLGAVAPDFVAPCVPDLRQRRLSSFRGKPCLLAFYRPNSKTSAGTLAVVEALHAHTGGGVVAVAVFESPAVAATQATAVTLTAPLLDGRDLAELYAIDSYPKFFLLDADGLLTWQFDGFGPETGFLARQQFDRLTRTEVGGAKP